ncbi:hypothetical protein MBTS_21790 [Methylobacterium bullatum]|nr:hypothetical protein [Methylobacterium bullatum]
MTTLAVLGTFGAAMTAHAASDLGRQARSNGPNMPLSRDVVPSEIRPQEPAATGSMKGRGGYGEKSRWRDIRRPSVRRRVEGFCRDVLDAASVRRAGPQAAGR